ncbi:hypothetical protein RchiOBHm_Chr3g0459531 [Rosa chinensis]|uniref:Uncharacterized protein n=1 Tax=Rosa chinensis TaxID=74649 RepID=A0A2P6R880_ROSCH|nr:hypothetical protein RchiOBHm_Chr3g0459531 [Rosa chinensis]
MGNIKLLDQVQWTFIASIVFPWTTPGLPISLVLLSLSSTPLGFWTLSAILIRKELESNSLPIASLPECSF